MAITVIMVEVRETAAEIAGWPVGTSNVRQNETGGAVDFRGPADVIANEKVQLSIIVVINPGGARAPIFRPGNSCGLRHFTKPSFAFIMKKIVSPHRGNEYVGHAIIVVITNGNAHPITTYVQTGPGGDICEMTMAVIVIKGHGGGCRAWRSMCRPVGTIDEQQVRVAIVIVVEERDTAPQGFGKQFVSIGAVVMEEMDASALSNIGELGGGDFVARFGSDGLRAGGKEQEQAIFLCHRMTAHAGSEIGQAQHAAHPG